MPALLLLSSVFAGLWGYLVPAETAAQRYHRKGVHCMEVIERTECAIENFQALLNERTTERELVTDGMLRLVRLYRDRGELEQIKPLLRRYWKTGMKLESRGHVPHSVRYLPGDFDVLITADISQISTAPITVRLGDDPRDLLLSCDSHRRRDIYERQRWKRSERIAREQKREFTQVIYEQLDRDQRPQVSMPGSGARRPPSAAKNSLSPVFLSATCETARALGHSDLLPWERVTAALSHKDFARSAAFARIQGFDELLQAAQSAGRIVPVAANRWQLPGVIYNGQPVELARLDLDEATIAPASIMGEIIAAHERRMRTDNKDLTKLLGKIPRDAGFFAVMTESAINGLGTQALGPALWRLLPHAEGLQVSGVFGEDFGLFTRVPTTNPVKGRILVAILRYMIGRGAEQDATAQEMLSNLDVTEASDRQALLASYLLSAKQIEKFILE